MVFTATSQASFRLTWAVLLCWISIIAEKLICHSCMNELKIWKFLHCNPY